MNLSPVYVNNVLVRVAKAYVLVNIQHALHMQLNKPLNWCDQFLWIYATFYYLAKCVFVIFSHLSHWKRKKAFTFPFFFFGLAWQTMSDSWLNHQSLYENLSPIRRDEDLFPQSQSNLYICIHIYIKMHRINSLAVEVTWMHTREVWTNFLWA